MVLRVPAQVPAERLVPAELRQAQQVEEKPQPKRKKRRKKKPSKASRRSLVRFPSKILFFFHFLFSYTTRMHSVALDVEDDNNII